MRQRKVDGKTRLIHPVLVDTSFLEKERKPLACWRCDPCAVQIDRYKFFMKPGVSPLQSARLFDQLSERIFYLHYSLTGPTS